MIHYPDKDRYTAEDLAAIIRLLRDPETGCPWDRVQTHASIRMNFLEEAYEAVEAIDLDDPALLCEELGDVLMQVVFHARIEEERGNFGWMEVCDGVCRKLLKRHPNIFDCSPALQGINDWDMLKNMEKGRATLQSDLASVPQTLPALMRAAKLQSRAGRYGVAVPVSAERPAALAAAALAAPKGSAQAEEALGELLFMTAALARRAGVDPEQALQRRNARFAASSSQVGAAVPAQSTIPEGET